MVHTVPDSLPKDFLQTGLRTGELVGLKWEDIDFENKTLKVQRSMEYRYSVGVWRVGEPKSKSGYRTIPLTDEAIRILKAQKEKDKSNSYGMGGASILVPKTLQKILGHSNIGITMNLYVHITEEEKQREIDLVACALNVG